MRILITGVAGFLGYHLAKSLLDQENEVIGIDNFNQDYPSYIKRERVAELAKSKLFRIIEADIVKNEFPKELKDIDIDYLVHLVTKDFFYEVPEDVRYLKYINGTVVSTIRSLDFSQDLNVKKFFFSSGFTVYGSAKKPRLSESDLIPKPISPQGASKLEAEQAIRFLNYMYGIPCIIFRLSTVYGPFGRPYTLVPYLIHRISNNLPIKTISPLDSTRDYLYVSDAVEYMLRSFNKRLKIQTLNIGSGEVTSIKQMISVVANALDKNTDDLKIEEDNNRSQKMIMPSAHISVDRARKILKYIPKVTLSKGIQKTVEWYKKHPKILSDSTQNI